MPDLGRRPASLDEPKPTYPPCPQCGGPVAEKITRDGKPFFYELAEKHRMPSLHDIPVLMCKACRIMAAHVERVADVWRDAGMPGLAARLVADVLDGLRDRRMWESDANDPMWR